jgi:plastocyanin
MPEPKIWKITIEQDKTTNTASFNPPCLTIALNDGVFWHNNTPNPHQPAPVNGTPDQWVSTPIPPGGQSPQVIFDDAPDKPPAPSYPYQYYCAIDPKAATEKGMINVNTGN